jgi:hypothetical protein
MTYDSVLKAVIRRAVMQGIVDAYRYLPKRKQLDSHFITGMVDDIMRHIDEDAGVINPTIPNIPTPRAPTINDPDYDPIADPNRVAYPARPPDGQK